MSMEKQDKNSSVTKNGTTKTTTKSKGKVWYSMKTMEFVFIATCVLLLLLNQYLTVIDDDFTNITTSSPSSIPQESSTKLPDNNEPYKKAAYPKFRNRVKREVTLSNLLQSNIDDHMLLRMKRDTNSNKNHSHETKLSSLLVLYPSSTAILVILSMEIIGELLNDPINKLSNILLISICFIIGITMFAISLISAIRSKDICMILISILSAASTIIIVIDIIFLLLSKNF